MKLKLNLGEITVGDVTIKDINIETECTITEATELIQHLDRLEDFCDKTVKVTKKKSIFSEPKTIKVEKNCETDKASIFGRYVSAINNAKTETAVDSIIQTAGDDKNINSSMYIALIKIARDKFRF